MNLVGKLYCQPENSEFEIIQVVFIFISQYKLIIFFCFCYNIVSEMILY